jgi:hypothetical protein
MKYHVRKFHLKVYIRRPDYTAQANEQDVAVFSGDVNNDESTDMIAYSFEESIDNVDGQFSITLIPTVDKNGLSWVDKIQPRDIALFEEEGKIRFAGVVSQVRYVAQMGEGGASRTIMVTGHGFGYLLSVFKLVMDYHLWTKGPSSKSASTQLITDLANAGDDAKSILKAIYDNFMKLCTTSDAGAAPAGIKKIIERYIDADSQLSNKLKLLYKMAVGLYQEGQNDIWSIWKAILPAPLYELFGRWDYDSNKYLIFARQAPFDAADWNALPITEMNDVVLLDYSVGRDDSQVYTFFFAVLYGGSLDRNEILTLEEYSKTRKINESKWPMYGYRPMELSLRFFNRDPDAGQKSEEEIIRKASETLYNWYGKNDELLNGQISIITIYNDDVMQVPRIGERLSFLGGEFYIERTEHTWAMGKSPRTMLSVTRGYVYNNGSMSGPITGLGNKVQKAEGVRT